MILWGHIKLLIDKCHDNPMKFNFYVDKVIENYCSRTVLLNFLDTDLYERQGQVVINFQYTLPKETSDLAQKMTKNVTTMRASDISIRVTPILPWRSIIAAT
jgi:predicted nuclease of restriction endonuclease-like (RecB) superfamily